MFTISADEAKEILNELLDRVATGQTVLITRDDRPIAVLAPPLRKHKIANEIEQMRKLRKGNFLGDDISIRELIDAGRS